MAGSTGKQQRRNKAFADTHSELIEAAVRLIAASGVEALSMARDIDTEEEAVELGGRVLH